jgi:hypothetical protein
VRKLIGGIYLVAEPWLGQRNASKPKEVDMSSIRTQARGESSRLNVIRLLAFGTLLIFPATARAQQNPPITEQIAKTYGLDSFGQIEAIRYTWNADLPGVQLSHRWEWSPKTDTVSYEGKDKEGKPVKASYQRSQLSTQSDAIKKEIDPAFINDQYWFLLPLHVVWDGATVTDEGLHKLALGDASAERVVVKYPSDGGYEPGDTWDLYVGADKRIVEIAYHHGANKPPKLVIATWADHKKAGPLLVATDHRGTFDGKPLRVSISDVSVKLTGSEKWINAQ